jgi:hypothetical protein
MKKRFGLIALLSLIFVLSSMVMMAQGVDDEGNPNDPTVNERANACYETGSMETKCGNNDWNKNGVVDSYEIQWDWTCGWHLIRFEYELVSREDFPTQCSILLPSEREVVEEAVVVAPPAIFPGCVGPVLGIYYLDFGSSLIINNSSVFTDSACTSVEQVLYGSVVYAADSSAAAALCPAGPSPTSIGSNVWGCVTT